MNEQVEPGSGQAALRSAQLLVSASEVCFEALSPFIERDWRSVRARDLDWSVWDTLVHVNDDLYFYAAQILLADEGDYICFELAADDHATPERLLAALAVQARLLATTVTVADPGSRAHHVCGPRTRSGSPPWAWWKPSSIPTTRCMAWTARPRGDRPTTSPRPF